MACIGQLPPSTPAADSTDGSQPHFPVGLTWTWRLTHPALQEFRRFLQVGTAAEMLGSTRSPPCLNQACTSGQGERHQAGAWPRQHGGGGLGGEGVFKKQQPDKSDNHLEM